MATATTTTTTSSFAVSSSSALSSSGAAGRGELRSRGGPHRGASPAPAAASKKDVNDETFVGSAASALEMEKSGLTEDGKDALGVFTALWAQVMSLQVVKLYVATQKLTGNRPIAFAWLMLMSFGCCAAALFPHRSEALLALCGISVPVLFFTGSQSNHVFMEMAVCIAILGSFSRRRSRWQAKCTSAVRLFLVALYFVTGVHKLNADWHEAEWSCCNHMLGGILALKPLRFLTELVPLSLGPTFTAVTELGLPFLLLAPQHVTGRTFRVATVWASAFHLPICMMLPPMSVYPFSLLMAPLYVFMVPAQITRWIGRANLLLMVPVILLAAKSWPKLMAPELPDGEEPYEYPPYGCWAAGVIWCIVAYAGLIFMAIFGGEGAAPVVNTRFSRLLAFGVLGFGSLPYLGVRNYPALAMFSNLRTEAGRGNHLVLGDDFDFLGWQRDYVTIHETDIPALALAQVDLAPLYTPQTQTSLKTITAAAEFWLTPPLEAWSKNYTRLVWREYSMPFMELRRRIAPLAQNPNSTGFVRYTRTLAKANLKFPALWSWLGKKNLENDVVIRDNVIYALNKGDHDEELEEVLPWWQARLGRWRTFDVGYSPCRH
mmetsp:Transcript_38349/g.81280  ORF Transcript_38349/g.81280 Transcript_38349/m.81280 type:complete len:603 (-) Transcript_38349:778-2586(-)